MTNKHNTLGFTGDNSITVLNGMGKAMCSMSQYSLKKLLKNAYMSKIPVRIKTYVDLVYMEGEVSKLFAPLCRNDLKHNFPRLNKIASNQNGVFIHQCEHSPSITVWINSVYS